MSSSIIYSSKTGNTKMLAEALFESAKEKFTCCTPIPENIPEDDTLVLGFWTDKGTADEPFLNFAKQLRNKKIFLFGTAGFGQDKSYFENIISRVSSQLDPSCTVLGSFMCQGKMSEGIRAMYEKQIKEGTNPRAPMLLENFKQALSHPDGQDIENLKNETFKVI